MSSFKDSLPSCLNQDADRDFSQGSSRNIFPAEWQYQLHLMKFLTARALWHDSENNINNIVFHEEDLLRDRKRRCAALAAGHLAQESSSSPSTASTAIQTDECGSSQSKQEELSIDQRSTDDLFNTHQLKDLMMDKNDSSPFKSANQIRECDSDKNTKMSNDQLKFASVLDKTNKRISFVEERLNEIRAMQLILKQDLKSLQTCLPHKLMNETTFKTTFASIEEIIDETASMMANEIAKTLPGQYGRYYSIKQGEPSDHAEDFTKSEQIGRFPEQTNLTRLYKKRDFSTRTASASKPVNKTIFASGFPPETLKEEIEISLKFYHGFVVVADKVKTGNSHHASFYVSVSSEEYEELLKPHYWPQGITIKPFSTQQDSVC